MTHRALCNQLGAMHWARHSPDVPAGLHCARSREVPSRGARVACDIDAGVTRKALLAQLQERAHRSTGVHGGWCGLKGCLLPGPLPGAVLPIPPPSEVHGARAGGQAYSRDQTGCIRGCHAITQPMEGVVSPQPSPCAPQIKAVTRCGGCVLPPLRPSRVWSLSWPSRHPLRHILTPLISLREGDLMAVSPLGRAQATGGGGGGGGEVGCLMLPAGRPSMRKELQGLGGWGGGVPPSRGPSALHSLIPKDSRG